MLEETVLLAVNHEGKHCDAGSEDAQFRSIQTHLTFSIGFLHIKTGTSW